jgi:oligosaccharide repeat unit polymerase
MMLWLLFPFAPVLGAYVYVARKHGGFLNPDGLFVLFNSIGLLGTLIVVDTRNAIDRRYAWIVFFGLVAYTTISMVIRWYLFDHRQPLTSAVTATPLNRWVWGLYGLSLLVSLGYYVAVGHIVLIDSALAHVTGHQYNATNARFSSYAVGRYFFPGYVNQFKNCILPVTTLAIVHSLWVRKLKWRAPLTLAMLAVMLVMVGGTGQRGAAVIIFIVATLAAAKSRWLTRTRLVIAGMVGIAGFVLQTTLLQRQAAQLDAAQGTLDRIAVFAESLWSRAVLENPSAGLTAFHYTERLPSAWGREWLEDISGVLPGRGGSPLPNQVYQTLYPRGLGTAPASLWGGIYYNFGPILGLFVTIIFAFAFVLLTRRLFTKPQSITRAVPSGLTLLALCGVAVSSGAWVAGSPLTMLNQGLFAYLFIYFLSTRVIDRVQPPTDAGFGHAPIPAVSAAWPRMTRQDSSHEIK